MIDHAELSVGLGRRRPLLILGPAASLLHEVGQQHRGVGEVGDGGGGGARSVASLETSMAVATAKSRLDCGGVSRSDHHFVTFARRSTLYLETRIMHSRFGMSSDGKGVPWDVLYELSTTR